MTVTETLKKALLLPEGVTLHIVDTKNDTDTLETLRNTPLFLLPAGVIEQIVNADNNTVIDRDTSAASRCQ